MSDYFKQGKYLPKWFRDFHIQKLFFRMMHKRGEQCIQRNIAQGNQKYLDKFNFEQNEPISWIQGHVYVVDNFLWFMAKCGYTLQKNHKLSKDPRCYQILEELDKFQSEEITQFTQIFQKEKETN